MARSESNAITGKATYPDLNLTQYPDKIDSRDSGDSGYNPNMRGYENLKDYNYAEHINALEDAVMALQRALGITPYKDKDGLDKTTVGNRITNLENKDYDPRYGGSGWITSQTIIGHTHTGEVGHPSQVNLSSEVQGQLGKGNLNLTFNNAGGLTGADLSLSNTDSRKIKDVVNDKLSVSQGGTVQKDLEVKGSFASRLFREWDPSDAIAGTLITDYTTLTNQARRASGTEVVKLFNNGVKNLFYGKYVLGVRAKVSSRISSKVMELRWYDRISNAWSKKSELILKGTDFDAANQWQMFYLTFDYTGNQADSYGIFHVWKSLTSTSIDLDIDNVFIMPTHPAIYDR